MQFKNLQLYRLTDKWNWRSDQLEQMLATRPFSPCEGLTAVSQGWVPPRESGTLVHTVNRQMLFCLCTEKKLLPAKVVNKEVEVRAKRIAQQQGFTLGRKQMRELKDEVEDDLLPRAFPVQAKTFVWIDPVNRWMVVEASSPAKADDVFGLLLKSCESLPVESLRVQYPAAKAMTHWLAAEEAPGNFTIDRDTELRATGTEKSSVRYVSHTLETEDVRNHIASGKQCTRLALTWNERISFLLTESLQIKRLAPLDILREDNQGDSTNDVDRADSDFALMTGEIGSMLADLVDALGGIDLGGSHATDEGELRMAA